MKTPPISVCVITFNEEDRIRDCLESVKWADEIIVVDSFSADNTVKICKEYTDNVFLHEWPGYVEQKNYALNKALNNWVLCLDADERISKELKEEFERELAADVIQHNGFIFPRRSCYMGRMINHGGWYPDRQLRLFRKDKGSWAGMNPHDKITLEGPKKRLKNDMIHYPYRDMRDQLKTIDNYSTIFADQMIMKGKRLNILLLFIRPPTRFIETYFWKRGFLDGLPGLINILAASFYVFLKYAKWYERERRGNA